MNYTQIRYYVRPDIKIKFVMHSGCSHHYGIMLILKINFSLYQQYTHYHVSEHQTFMHRFSLSHSSPRKNCSFEQAKVPMAAMLFRINEFS